MQELVPSDPNAPMGAVIGVPLTPPLIMVSKGCSGSTFLHKFAARLTEAHGMPVAQPKEIPEGMRASTLGFCIPERRT